MQERNSQCRKTELSSYMRKSLPPPPPMIRETILFTSPRQSRAEFLPFLHEPPALHTHLDCIPEAVFYCDYCDTPLTHDSPSVGKTHCSGRKHKENRKDCCQKWMGKQVRSLTERTSTVHQQGKLPSTPLSAPSPAGAMTPPPPSLLVPLCPGMTLAPHMGGGPPPFRMMPVGPVPGMKPPMGGHMPVMPGPPLWRPPACPMMVSTWPTGPDR
ncbi:U1 small nuclear ribonucleoprotein C-like [Sturnira hondurensis]|uniref:U1 small nuclear ribonucleoprotein C-like n=1 Tax=Sturnira hondurensis TaxID=192404 RepID=UPI00187A5372|nr:U1 small nuclear ribonucleoprotein C-like [Sturnira hondurensis]